MNCQILIACVVDVVHTLDRAAPEEPSRMEQFSRWAHSFPEPVGFFVFLACTVIGMTLVILLAVVLVVSVIEGWKTLLPERPVKRRHGDFVGD